VSVVSGKISNNNDIINMIYKYYCNILLWIESILTYNYMIIIE